MGQIAENRHAVILRGHIKIAGRLIGQNNPRPIAQRPRNGDTLLLAAGQVQDTFLGRSNTSTISCFGLSNDTPDASMDSTMFSSTVSAGSRLKLWKITPMSWSGNDTG